MHTITREPKESTVKIIIVLGIIATILVAAQDAKASHSPLGSWKYQISTDPSDNSETHFIIGKGMANEIEGAGDSVTALITAFCDGRLIGMALEVETRLQDQETMRIRFDAVEQSEGTEIEKQIKTINVTFEALAFGNFDIIIPATHEETDEVLKGMDAAEAVEFEIYNSEGHRLLVSVPLEGFSEAWEHVKPHCKPYGTHTTINTN